MTAEICNSKCQWNTQLAMLPDRGPPILQKVPMKDFAAEVRGVLDVEHFLHQAVLLLDITETSLEGVVDIMLERMLAADESQCSPQEVKTALFTNDTGKCSGSLCNAESQEICSTVLFFS